MELSAVKKTGLPLYLTMLIILALALPQMAVSSTLTPPQAVVQKLSDRMQRALKGKPSPARVYSLVNQILVPYINFHMVSQRALGKKYWNKATSGQRSRFTSQFKRMLVRTYGTAFSSFNSWQMQHTGARKSGRTVAVSTRVTPSGTSSVNVVYLMYQGKGGWRAYDIIIAGVSLAKSHSASFQGIVRSEGMEGLIKRLGAMNRTNKKT